MAIFCTLWEGGVSKKKGLLQENWCSWLRLLVDLNAKGGGLCGNGNISRVEDLRASNGLPPKSLADPEFCLEA
jgi:hypothetical protein